MDWPSVINRLIKHGLTQKQIAERCGCAQSSISALLNNKTAVPAYSIGRELERMASELGKPSRITSKPKAVA